MSLSDWIVACLLGYVVFEISLGALITWLDERRKL